MTPTYQEIVSLAQQYCELIEASGAEKASWLRGVSSLLPKLRLAMTGLDGNEYRGRAFLKADLDTRFELYTELLQLLGDRDPYRLEFDPEQDAQSMTGSLADDLTDIYCELKHGLRTLAEDPERSIQTWLSGFAQHWGLHLSDAERHLALLASQGRL